MIRAESTNDTIPRMIKLAYAVKNENLYRASLNLRILLEMGHRETRLILAVVDFYLLAIEKNDRLSGYILQRAILDNLRFNFSEILFSLRNDNKSKEYDSLISIVLDGCQDAQKLYEIGMQIAEKGLHKTSLLFFKKSCEIKPSIKCLLYLGQAYLLTGDYDKALHVLNAPGVPVDDLITIRLKSKVYVNLNQSDNAKAILKRAIEINSSNIDKQIVADLCAIYYNEGSYQKALDLMESLSLKDFDSYFIRVKASILRKLGKVKEAISLFEQVLEEKPNDIATIMSLGNAYYYGLGDKINARKNYEKALSLEPNNIDVLEKLSNFLYETRRGVSGEDLTLSYNLALKLLSLSSSKADSLISVYPLLLAVLDHDNFEKLNQDNKIISKTTGGYAMGRIKTMKDRVEFLESHRRWGENLEDNAAKNPIKRKVRQRINNKIRVGILSSDLRKHPVGYFAWPLFEYLDQSNFELYAYSAYPYNDDPVENLFMKKATSFRKKLDEDNHKVAQLIADDSLDILFELGGYTLHNRLLACSYKPAPIQVSWLGYPHSIGMPTAIDYILVDPYTCPTDKNLIIEKPFIVPETWVSLDKIGFGPVPITQVLPEEKNGYITFGTLNAIHKISPEVIAAWAEIMHMVPESKFLYSRFEIDSSIAKENFCKYMEKNGINRDRLKFIASNEYHLPFYNEIDIALDTFPHTGGTTSCETLWMGVPLITLVGNSIFERLSYSNLSNAGLGDFCAHDIGGYKKRAYELSLDIIRRRYLRKSLRNQILANPLGKPKNFAENFYQTIKKVLNK